MFWYVVGCRFLETQNLKGCREGSAETPGTANQGRSRVPFEAGQEDAAAVDTEEPRDAPSCSLRTKEHPAHPCTHALLPPC